MLWEVPVQIRFCYLPGTYYVLQCGKILNTSLINIIVLELSPVIAVTNDPCMPSPCGLYAECRNINGVSSCSCLPSYVGSPPYCRPECMMHSDCSSDLACIAEKCRNPCAGSCGIYATCFVNNHIPVCLCPDGFTGDPFRQCSPKPIQGIVLTILLFSLIIHIHNFTIISTFRVTLPGLYFNHNNLIPWFQICNN